jgi:hypothetical protein
MTMKATVTFEITIAEEVTDEQLREFLRFEIGEIAQIKAGNPLSGYDLASCEVEIRSIRTF